MIIAFEGHNGVGKTTIAKNISYTLGYEYLYSVDKNILENGLKERFIKDASWYASALFFLAGSMETKRNIIENYNNKNVVLDRSFWSTLAVHWDRGDSELRVIKDIIKDAKNYLPIPDVIFLLNADYTSCNDRINSKTDILNKHLDDVVDRDYFQKELNFYDWLRKNNTDSIIIDIDTNNLSIDEITNLCLNHIDKLGERV